LKGIVKAKIDRYVMADIYIYRTAQELQSLAKSAFALNNLEISGQPQ
jgi:hypothetical protein